MLRVMFAVTVVMLALIPVAVDGESTITVMVSAPTTETGDCRIPVHNAPAESGWTVRWVDDDGVRAVAQQVIVSDASGAVTAVAELAGTVEGEGCIADVTLAVPDSPFVTVRINDRYIATVPREQLDVQHYLVITFGG